MVRMTPRKTGGFAWDPFVAIGVYVKAYLATVNGWKDVNMSINGHSYSLSSNPTLYFDSKTTIAERYALATSDSINVALAFLKDGERFERTLRIFNIGMTVCGSKDKYIQTLANGDVLEDTVQPYRTYLEAVEQNIKLSGVHSVNGADWTRGIVNSGSQLETDLRPFLAYIPLNATGDDLRAIGPAFRVGVKVADVDLNLSSNVNGKTGKNQTLPLFTMANFESFREEGPEKLPGKSDDASGTWYLTGDGLLTVLDFAQNMSLHDGKPVEAETYLRCLQIVVYFETVNDAQVANPFIVNDNGIRYVIPLQENFRHRWELAPSAREFVEKNIILNADIESLFDRYDYTDVSVVLRDKKGNAASVTSSKANSSCFALAYAYAVSLLGGGRMTDMVDCLRALVDSGAVYVAGGLLENDAGSLTGSGSEAAYTLKLYDGRTVRVQRSNWQKQRKAKLGELADGTVVIVGWDAGASKRSGPDHYVVATVSGGRIFVLWDPYRRQQPVEVGADITDRFLALDYKEVLLSIPTVNGQRMRTQ